MCIDDTTTNKTKFCEHEKSFLEKNRPPSKNYVPYLSRKNLIRIIFNVFCLFTILCLMFATKFVALKALITELYGLFASKPS